jgi:hypothetical protein
MALSWCYSPRSSWSPHINPPYISDTSHWFFLLPHELNLPSTAASQSCKSLFLLCLVIKWGRRGKEVVHKQFVTSSFYFPIKFCHCSMWNWQVLCLMLFVLPQVHFHIIPVASKSCPFAYLFKPCAMQTGGVECIAPSHRGGPGSRTGSMWGFWWTKWHWGRFSPSTSVSPANHSTDFSSIILTRGWHNRPLSGRSVEWTFIPPPPPPTMQIKKKINV